MAVSMAVSVMCEGRCRRLLVVRMSEDEPEERLQWFHKLFWTLLGQVASMTLRPFLNMTLWYLIF